MTRRKSYGAFVVACFLFACSSDDKDGIDPNGADANVTDTSETPSDRGSATLTIGEQTWEFDSFGCAFGYAATQSTTFVFSSSSFGVHSDGSRVQMQAEIEDDTAQERYEGDGVIYSVYVNDIENFSDPVVDWHARGAAAEIVVNIDGDSVTASGVFDDGLTELEIEQVSGTLDATCGSQSVR
ncbi:MAG: hypothetical protein IPJ88_04535 [Myxococcales bacterium]|nr:MAG: hypothetical protein IPJ88_04535 [Myxococcales bacterium]